MSDSTPATVSSADVTVSLGRAEDFYGDWPKPTCIVSDGAYGVGGFPGDPRRVEDLPEWYAPHFEAWTRAADPTTTLWFWGTELGWAEVHPHLKALDWRCLGLNTWDKGIGYLAGHVNTATLRRFPAVSEVCAHYIRPPRTVVADGVGVTLQDWLRSEWSRTGLPLKAADEACGVRAAASRKYLTADSLWYTPPPEAMAALKAFADRRGDPKGAPYFEGLPDGLTPAAWGAERAKFNCPFGVANVWRLPALAGAKRFKDESGTLHPNQKPVELMQLIITASTDPGDMVWEPFGGLCGAAVASLASGRRCRAAEPERRYFDVATTRICLGEGGQPALGGL